MCSICCRKCFPEDEEEDKQVKTLYKTDGEDKDSSDEESKLLVTEETKDSDYSTDYSYSYQYDKSQDSQPIPQTTSFKDLEKQDVPDYASMSSFREDEMLDKSTLTPAKHSIGTVISGTTFDELKKLRKVEFTDVPCKPATCGRRLRRKRKRRRKGEERPLLDGSSCSCTCSSDDSGPIKHLQSPVLTYLKSSSSSAKCVPCNTPSEDTSEPSTVTIICKDPCQSVPRLNLSSVQRSMPDSSSSIDSEINCNCSYVKMMVPELDLSSSSSTPKSCKSYVGNIFGNVRYDEVSESPRSTTSSSRCSSSKRPLTKSMGNKATMIKPKLEASVRQKVDVGVCAKPEDRYKFEENQRRKVKQYYKAVKDIPCARVEEKRKSGKITKLIQRIIPKVIANNIY